MKVLGEFLDTLGWFLAFAAIGVVATSFAALWAVFVVLKWLLSL